MKHGLVTRTSSFDYDTYGDQSRCKINSNTWQSKVVTFKSHANEWQSRGARAVSPLTSSEYLGVHVDTFSLKKYNVQWCDRWTCNMHVTTQWTLSPNGFKVTYIRPWQRLESDLIIMSKCNYINQQLQRYSCSSSVLFTACADESSRL